MYVREEQVEKMEESTTKVTCKPQTNIHVAVAGGNREACCCLKKQNELQINSKVLSEVSGTGFKK